MFDIQSQTVAVGFLFVFFFCNIFLVCWSLEKKKKKKKPRIVTAGIYGCSEQARVVACVCEVI